MRLARRRGVRVAPAGKEAEAPTMLNAVSGRAKGALLVTVAALCWSSGGIVIRLIDADGFTICFWRSLLMAVAVAVGLSFAHGRNTGAVIRGIGLPGLVSSLLLAGTFICYVLSITRTDVANTLVLMSASPLVAAVLARLFLGERFRPVCIAAITVAAFGIVVMVSGDLGDGDLLGNLLALGVALCFGTNIVVLRSARQVDMVPTTLIAGVLAALAILPFAHPFAVSLKDFGLLAILGFFQLAFGLFLFVRGARLLVAAEAGLFTLLETVAAPLWVWLALGEQPTPHALLGGSLILGAVVAYSVLKGHRDDLSPTLQPAIPEGAIARSSPLP